MDIYTVVDISQWKIRDKFFRKESKFSVVLNRRILPGFNDKELHDLCN